MTSTQKFFLLFLISISAFRSQGSDNLLERRKRNLPLVFPEGGTLKLLLGFGIPIKNPANVSLAFAFNFQYQYPVPPNITLFTQYYSYVDVARKKREIMQKESHEQRSFFYESVERAMDNFGINGPQCLRRTICEAAEAPINQNNGMIGDLFHLLFTPSNKHDYDDNGSNQLEVHFDDYYDARRAGELNYDCRKLYPLCPLGHGLFDIISIFE